MSVIYTTYNVELKNYLSNIGIKYLLCGRAVKNLNKLFWVYERNDELNVALEDWFNITE